MTANTYNQTFFKTMKAKLFFLATLALVAASCSKNAETPEATPRTVTLTATLPADEPEGRLAYTRGESGTYKAKWNEGDALSVVYKLDKKNFNDKFSVSSISTDGRTATFTCRESNLPASGTVAAGIYYPYRPANNNGYIFPVINMSNPGEVASDTREGMGNYAVFYALGVEATDAKFPHTIELTGRGSSFVRIAKGTPLFTGAPEEAKIIGEQLKVNGRHFAVYEPMEYFLPDYTNYIKIFLPSPEYPHAKIKNGVLQRDLYIPFIIKEAYSGTAELKVNPGSGKWYTWIFPFDAKQAMVCTVPASKITPQAW